MAEVNLLTSSYTGKLGRTTGVKWKGKQIVKGKIWSKTPQSAAAKGSVRAFEALNRVSSAIAKKWFYWLGIKADKMLKHNAVARLLKDCVSNHVFTPSGFFPVFSKDGSNALISYTWNGETGFLSIEAETYKSGTVGRDFSWLVLVFDQTGKVYYIETPETKRIDTSIYIPLQSEQEPFIMLLNSEKDGKRYRLGGLVLNYLVVSEVFYSELSKSSVWFYEEETETAGTNYDSVTVDTEEETLYIPS